jgi:hypothetical protein
MHPTKGHAMSINEATEIRTVEAAALAKPSKLSSAFTLLTRLAVFSTPMPVFVLSSPERTRCLFAVG